MMTNRLRNALSDIQAYADRNWSLLGLTIEDRWTRWRKYILVAAGCLVAGIVLGRVL